MNQEGNGCISRTDNGGYGCAEDNQSCEAVCHVACTYQECIGCRIVYAVILRNACHAGIRGGICQVDSRKLGDNAEDSQEQKDTYDCRDSDTHDGTALCLLQVLFTGYARIDQTVCAGEGDIAADGSAEQGKNCRYGSRDACGRNEGIRNCCTYRRLGLDHDDEDDNDHDGAQVFNNFIDQALCLLGQEQYDGEQCGQNVSDLDVHAEKYVEAHAAAADITHVECQAAEGDKACQDEAQAVDDFICHILAALSGIAEHAPDVHLCDGSHDQRDQDNESEARAEAGGKCCQWMAWKGR